MFAQEHRIAMVSVAQLVEHRESLDETTGTPRALLL
jgi:hypothetical protein